MRVKRIFSSILVVCSTLLIIGVGFSIFGYLQARNQNSWISVNTLSQLEEGGFIDKDVFGLYGVFFSVFADPRGKIRISSPNDTIILSSLLYYASADFIEEQVGLENISRTLINDSTLLVRGTGLNESDVLIWLTANHHYPSLDVKIKTTYTSTTEVAKEALLLKFDLPVEEVFKKSGAIDNRNFGHEYWLNRQGVKFGKEETQALIYHTPGISSLQLIPSHSLLSVNLEYAYDHPYIYFPYQRDNAGRWIDQSISVFPKNYVRVDSLTIWLGELPAAIPRLLMLPNGYLAGFVFTEHADGGTIDRHRTVYFGADTITSAANASGGFWGNKIPVTKSLFYVNSEDPCLFATIKNNVNDTSFSAFLRQLFATGNYELCLHTPENGNSDKITMREASAYMRVNFETVSWIDHGMLGGRNNRECFHADGLDLESTYYSADIWEEYGVKYFWNTAFELKEPYTFFTKKALMKGHLLNTFRCFWNSLFSPTELFNYNFFQASLKLKEKLQQDKVSRKMNRFFDEALPTPLFWLHPTRTGQFYSWGTYYADNNNDLWGKTAEHEVNVKKMKLEEMITHRQIFIDHGYYVRGAPKIDLTSVQDGRVRLNPYFEETLRYMAKRRDEGDLLLLTIKDLLDYQLLLEKISIAYRPDTVVITNNNSCQVNGLTLAAKNVDIITGDKVKRSRLYDDDMIIWFDIQAGESVSLTFKPRAVICD